MSIEVILNEPIPGLGSEADIVKVKSGYARNFLLPRKLAVRATAAGKKEIEALQKKRAQREAAELQSATELAESLNKATITFQMETVPESGKLFGSVTSMDIAERLVTMGHEVDRKKIQLKQPLKELGEHEVEIATGAGTQAKVKIVLEAAAHKDD